ncbi:Copper centre CuA [Cinnamomum micranthum f. kanehirae]|uniref:Copper centre CuA n=1 Tax=Cinnamomum micranthum f. kanehirae TaxID=337451 RepID=A0A3S3NT34_9MAGN|nr:Copper centre CuA [Cinnamomum micranthum f. kanehirae]
MRRGPVQDRTVPLQRQQTLSTARRHSLSELFQLLHDFVPRRLLRVREAWNHQYEGSLKIEKGGQGFRKSLPPLPGQDRWEGDGHNQPLYLCRPGAPRGYIRTCSDSPVIMDLVAWRGEGGKQLRSFVDSTSRFAYRIECKQGSLLTLLVACVGGKEGGIGKTRPYYSTEAFGKRLVASGEA